MTHPRIFIVDVDVVRYSGHFFNQVFGFREAAKARGLETRIYISRHAAAEIVATLDAHPILSPMPWNMTQEGVLSGFVNARRLLGPLFEDIERQGISKEDILVITSARPQLIIALAQWLGTRQESMRPAVFFRFSRAGFFDFRRMEFSETAWIYEFVSRMLLALPGGDRIFLTVNNERAVPYLEQLSLRRAFFLPIPKYYGAMAAPTERPADKPTQIYVHVHRSGELPERVSRALSMILQRRNDVTFAIRFCAYIFPTREAQEAVGKDFLSPGIEILPANQDSVGYLAAIDRADMVLLPYDPIEYHDITSGVFCEAVALGNIAIIPARTWMADHIVGGRATGVLFDNNQVDDMVAAIDRALDDRLRLQAEALSRGIRFREQYNSAKNLEGMLDLARQVQDMRLSYAPLASVMKVFDSQNHLGAGWHAPDGEWGMWSDGDRAEIRFTIRPGGKSLFFNALVYPFLAPTHPRIAVSLSANGVSLGEWSFDITRTDDLTWSWRHVQVPESVTASSEITIVFGIRSPASPKELGLSVDPRILGIALRQFSLGPQIELPKSSPLPELAGPTEPAELKPLSWHRKLREKLRWLSTPSE